MELSYDRELSRRDFLAASTGLALGLVEGSTAARGELKLGEHHVPADKNLDPAWVASLFARGEPAIYRGEKLTCIGMPIGGIGAGQLYLRGDGTLAEWAIFNHVHFTGYGETCYRTYTPPSPVDQGFALWLKKSDGPPTYHSLDKYGFPQVEFRGEYPIGKVRYVSKPGELLPVELSLEAFSPFIPLNSKESGIPGTILRFQIRNTSDQLLEAALGGWLQNVICQSHAGKLAGTRRTTLVRSGDSLSLLMTAEESPPALTQETARLEVFEDFESGTYQKWQKVGNAFGERPASGTLPNQQKVTGFGGKYLVNSFSGGDDTKGSLTSAEFTIRRRYINFRIGGGNQPGKACINLKVGNKVVRSATGKNVEKLEWDFWEVGKLQGQKAVIEILDQATGGWGHINIDDIEFADAPPKEAKVLPIKDQPDFGTLALTLLDPNGTGNPASFESFRKSGRLESTGKETPARHATWPLDMEGVGVGGLAGHFRIGPGETKDVVFLLTWHFAGGESGRAYARWWADALAVAKYLRDNLDRLTTLTRLFHETYYANSTLPRWLLERLLMPMSTLATDTVQWWRNGRFWAWEGVGCCHGTCTHVWNYAQGVARLFPDLERSARIMQDLGPALEPKTGRVAFRGEGPGFQYAADGQCGTVLKCYREHLMSPDGKFLEENWPRIKKVMEYAISRDGNADGIIEDNQHNTYDIDFVGPNTFVGALYLAALEAAARMAHLRDDEDFATRCRSIAAKGRQWTIDHLWSGEYFVQRVPQGKPDRFQYGDGCLADQLFGQNWAIQVGLGDVYPREHILKALSSIYRYNWAPDVGAQNKAHPPQRWFARPGEAGLFVCTWPRGGRMQEPVLYRDEVWTGCEYQLAATLLHEGMLREGLSIIRGVHDRYDGRRHNPWNEVECGDHYARAMASWGCLLALAGCHYDGPGGRLGFAPRMQPENFQCFFSTAEGWGGFRQMRAAQSQHHEYCLKYGALRLAELSVEAPAAAVVLTAELTLGETAQRCRITQRERQVLVTLDSPLLAKPGQTLTLRLAW